MWWVGSRCEPPGSSAMKTFLDFILPARWRRRRAPDQNANAAVLARLDDSDPVYRLLLDQAHLDAQNALRELMEAHCTDVDYWRGALAAHMGFIERIEQQRLVWRTATAQKQAAKQRGVL